MLRYVYFWKRVTEFVYLVLWEFPIGCLLCLSSRNPPNTNMRGFLLNLPAPITLNKHSCTRAADESGYAGLLH